MSNPTRELTHPSWHRASDEAPLTPRESLMSQMVRAQLIFDRRTPPGGMPAWRDEDGETVPVKLSARVGAGVGEFLEMGGGDATFIAEPSAFAAELNERLRLAQDRVAAEQVHLSQVDSVAGAYLGRPSLRLVK
jgi:hypothetical protein